MALCPRHKRQSLKLLLWWSYNGHLFPVHRLSIWDQAPPYFCGLQPLSLPSYVHTTSFLPLDVFPCQSLFSNLVHMNRCWTPRLQWAPFTNFNQRLRSFVLFSARRDSVRGHMQFFRWQCKSKRDQGICV